MDTPIVKTRRRKLKIWFSDKAIPEKEKSYISQLINASASFGEKAARRLEETYKIPPGYLDDENDEQPIKLITQDDLDIEEMGRLYRKMSPEDKVKFKGIAKIISNATTETKTQNGDD